MDRSVTGRYNRHDRIRRDNHVQPQPQSSPKPPGCDRSLVGATLLIVVCPADGGPWSALVFLILLLSVLGESTGCALRESREGIPSQAQATIDQVSQDIAAERYQELYDGAADEWRKANTLEESTAVFKKLKAKLGNIKNRSFHSAAEQTQSGGKLPGHSFVISYQTVFERGDGMETFTLLEKDGLWSLAGYFVNSSALK